MRLTLIDVVLLGLIAGGLCLAPWRDPAARRQAWWWLLLPVPAILLAVFGPLLLFRRPSDPALVQTLMNAQYVGMAASIVVVLSLVATLSKLRWSSLMLGAVAVFGAMAVGGINQIILAPSS
jgi:hypothetical protein